MGSTRGPALADHFPRVGGTLVQPGWEKGSPIMVPERQACTSPHTPLVEDMRLLGFGCPESISPPFSNSPLIFFSRTTPSSVFKLGVSLIKPPCCLLAKRRT